MIIKIEDFNGAEGEIELYYSQQWEEFSRTLNTMPLHLKASDQAGIQGRPIFDPVGTNEYIKRELDSKGWLSNIPIPKQFDFLGTDVDFGKMGILVEVQFSNYPFLLNNALRGELFYKAEISLSGKPTDVVIIVTKAHMFPASNSTLYFEQAKNQLTELIRYNVFDVPIRLVGLFEKNNENIIAIFSEYDNPRYSRTVVRREERICKIQPGKTLKSRCTIFLDKL